MSGEIITREAGPDDLPFIFGTWLNHYHANSYFAKKIRNGVYFHYHHLLAERIIARSKVLCASLAEEPEIILGYLVHEQSGTQGPVVHFAFTKKPWQRMGIARKLLEAAGLPSDLAGVSYTHPTFQWFQELEQRFPKAVYNPYLV